MPIKKSLQVRSNCPINFALEVFGDKWTLLIIRDIVYSGKRKHGEFMKSSEHIATNILADRLAKLECQGIIKKTIDSSDKRSEIFSLTEQGLGLIPLLLDLQIWSSKFGPVFVNRSAPFETAFKKDREKLIADVTESVRQGIPVFSNKTWFPRH